ncbi:beta-1,3-galactosyl-O-glycosyl-glycoprotein beta-1,6-N-acetylglucosaminyltransferase 4 isoform X1 [Taeniopygia guttata]
MEENAVPHTHHTPRAHKSAPSSRAGRRPGTAATRSGECAAGGHVPGQRGERFRQDKPELGGAAAAEPAARALLPAASLEAQIWVFGRGGGVWEEKEEGRHCVTPRQRSGAALRGERRAPGRAGPGRARRWRRPEQQEDGLCHRWCCGRAPVRRMKRHKWSYKCPSQRKILILCVTGWLIALLKLLHVERHFFPSKGIYLVEHVLSTSSYVRNRYSYSRNEFQYEINCSSIYEQDPHEIGKSLEIRRKEIVDLADEDVVAMTSDCHVYRSLRKYQLKPVSPEEESFPIAYSLVVHKDAAMVERLIHSLYSHQNVYCIHYDQKAAKSFKSALNNLAKCFPNIFIASKLETVDYAHISRLQADFNCLSDLMDSPVPWKYVINLCGQDFPLRSNFELVAELKKLDGGNMLETSKPSSSKRERFTYHYELMKVPYEYMQMPVKTNISKNPPPHDIEIFVGSAYFVLSREFIQYTLESSLAKDFFEWSRDTYSPDEHFWATLVRVPGVPGEVPRSSQDVTDLQSKTRLVKWNYLEDYLYPPCTGAHLRSVCIYGAGELRWLLNSGHWFANKIDSKVDPVLVKCLAEKVAEQQKEWVHLSSDEHFLHLSSTNALA